jgi:hypothetical protein
MTTHRTRDSIGILFGILLLPIAFLTFLAWLVFGWIGRCVAQQFTPNDRRTKC